MLLKKIKAILLKYGNGLFCIAFMNIFEVIGREFFLPYISAVLMDLILIGNFSSVGIFKWLLILLVSTFIINLINVITKKVEYKTYPMVEQHLRSNLFTYSHNLSVSFLQKNGAGYVENLLDSIADGILDIIRYAFDSIIPCIILLISFLVYLCFVYFWLGFVHIIWIIVYAISFIFLYKKTLKISKNFNKMKNKRSVAVIDALSNIKILRLFNLSNILSKKINYIFFEEMSVFKKYLKSDCFNTMISAIFCFVLEIIAYAILYRSLCYGFIKAHTVILILNIKLSMTDNLNDLLEKFIDLYEVMGQASQSYNQLLDIQRVNNNGIELQGPITSIEVRNLTYSIKNKLILNNLNLSLKVGDCLAIVGKSGVGKSVLLELLLKVRKPPNNSIFINGADINSYNIFSVYKEMSILLQKDQLLNMTLRENYNLIKKNITDEEISAALAYANISYLKPKLNLIVGTQGAHFSGGEIKRILFSFLYFKKTSIFIGDEPCNHLDTENQENFLGKIFKNHKSKIIIVSDHSKKFPPKSNKVLFLKAGGIGVNSTHEKLLSMPEYEKFFL